jgi:hypothetical protein
MEPSDLVTIQDIEDKLNELLGCLYALRTLKASKDNWICYLRDGHLFATEQEIRLKISQYSRAIGFFYRLHVSKVAEYGNLVTRYTILS